MAIERILETTLWEQSLAARDNDAAANHRDRLRTAFLAMRENVIPFVRNIHRDVLGLTVHEESHLDALWQTADCIAGDYFTLNPIEAFLFGASVLLHDTGLAVAAYPGGLAELYETSVWRDTEAGTRAQRRIISDEPLTADEKQGVLFATLRKLHAEQAGKLISFTFKRPSRQEAIPLLQDVGLHDALGAAIGRISNSHHWSSADLTNKLVSVAGTAPGFPSEWTLNELKVACLLRCADAAHIDALRAPTMMFAISDVGGPSADHWRFQNKLNAVTRSKDKLVYYAGQSFSVDEASSWWLAYDTIRMIDAEITSCNSILEETGAALFAVTGVQGADSPTSLSKTVRVEGWTPISAEVKVSDPVHLARTLGGRNLYGSGAIAPVRELLQNAVDAVRARRALEGRDRDWGKVRLIIESPDSGSSDVWLHVDDTGIGMSERVVTGPLIDFGKSFWSSALADDEFPGLRSSAPKLVGKFGIGFFSVFLLGDAVRVITRRFDAGEASASVLNFDELTRRPLLRRAATGELPLDYTTRVSVKLSERARRQIGPQRRGRFGTEHEVSFVALVKHLIISADVDVEIIDRLHKKGHKHIGEWLSSSPKAFLEEICALQEEREASSIVELHQERVRLITESDGTVVGRAALLLPRRPAQDVCIRSVGGFSLQNQFVRQYLFDDDVREDTAFTEASLVVGVLLADTFDAARMRASAIVSKEAIARWAQEQDSLINADRFTPPGSVPICHALLRLGAASSKLPFGFLGGRFASVEDFRKAISSALVIDLPLVHHDYENSLQFLCIENMTTPYFTSMLHPTVAVVVPGPHRQDLLSEDERREIVEHGRCDLNRAQATSIMQSFSLQYLARLAIDAWKSEPVYSIRRIELVAGDALAGQLSSWTLRLNKELQ